MKIGLLGPLEVTGDDGARVELPGGKLRTLLALLAWHANRPVPTGMIMEALWPRAAPQGAEANLRGYVHHLRKALGGDRVVRRPEGYLLRLGPGELDVERFRALVAEGRAAAAAGEPGRAAAALDAALAIWRGPEPAGPGPVPALAAGVAELRLQAIEQRFEADLELGRHGGVIAGLLPLIDQHPLRETFRGQLMRALIGDGRGAEALEVFESARRVLADELGVDPGQPLQDLHLAVLRGPVAPPAGPEPAVVVPRQLPARVAGFAGRTDWLARLDALLPTGGDEALPVATISGAGGIGKTSLAVHWAHRVAHRFPDGQLYANLRGFDPVGPPVEPAAALATLLTALGVPPRDVPAGPDDRESLYRSLLAGLRVLVVLDNAQDAAQVRPLLPGAAGCLALVTSRDPLGGLAAAGARPMLLGPLDPEEAYDLLERRLGADRLTADLTAVEAIIARCGGLALTLSVVAARAAMLAQESLGALAAELGRSRRPLDGFSGVDAATDPRAVFSWSYRVLEDGAARMFRLLPVHPGPEVTAGAAASLAGVPFAAAQAALRQLLAVSLLLEVGPGRYAFHDLIRAYAVELAEATDPAGQREAALERLLDHLVHTAHAATLLVDPNQTGIPTDPAATGVTPDPVEDRPQALAWFDAERPVLLAAIGRARADVPARAWQLACCCVVYLERSGHWHDKAAVLAAAREAARRTGERAVEARVLRGLGRTLGKLHRHEEAYAHLRAAIELYHEIGDLRGVAHATITLGEALEHAGRIDEAMAHDQRACELYRQAGDPVGEARALGGVASLQTQVGHDTAAIATGRQALALFVRMGDRNGIAGVHDTLGVAHSHLGAHDEAIAAFGRALEALADTGERFYVALVRHHLGDAHRAAGAAGAARSQYRQALVLFTRLGAREASGVQDKLAALDQELGRPAGATGDFPPTRGRGAGI